LSLHDSLGGVGLKIVGDVHEVLRSEDNLSFGTISLLSDSNHVVLLGSIHDLVVIPRTVIVLQPCGTFSTEEVNELLLIDDLEEFLFVTTTVNLDLLPGSLIEPHLDDGPDSGEHHGGIADMELAKLFGVVVLADLGGLLHDAVHLLVEHAD